MTVEIIVKCDSRNCIEEREIYGDTDYQIERIGWFIDINSGYHYCPRCWEIVKKELEKEIK